MRIPVPLAWILVTMAFLTSGVLRQFHERTPHAPSLPSPVGSLLFAAIFFLLLVSAREWRRGAVAGPGVRLGSVTPILLMLLVEKWVSLTLYNPVFDWMSTSTNPAPLLDAQFRAFAGVALVVVCVLISRFSVPTARKTWRRARPFRWPAAFAGTLIVVGVTYLIIGGISLLFGGGLALRWPEMDRLFGWKLGGQSVLAFAEELYYRGLLLSEMERLAPRLGLKSAVGRRWVALLYTAGLFGMEHLRLSGDYAEMARQTTFTISLGILLGLLVMLSANLHLTGGVHAYINWLLLGAAPHFAVVATGRPALPPGAYIGLALMVAFVVAFTFLRGRRRGRASPS